MAVAQQAEREIRADLARRAGDQDPHRAPSSPLRDRGAKATPLRVGARSASTPEASGTIREAFDPEPAAPQTPDHAERRVEAAVFERFTERARQVVVLAQDEARALKHNYIGTEHILLGLVREEEGLAARVLESARHHRGRGARPGRAHRRPG